MQLSPEQSFLYSRVAALSCAAAGLAASAAAVLTGGTLWYGSAALFWWAALGILNLRHKSSLWLLLNRPLRFLLFYSAIAGVFALADQYGLSAGLWFYPERSGAGVFFTANLILYPFGGLGMFELFYFLSAAIGKEPAFAEEETGAGWQRFIGAAELAAFVSMTALFVSGTMFPEAFAPAAVASVSALWTLCALVLAHIHLRDIWLLALFIFLATGVGLLIHGAPSPIAREWVYLGEPFLTAELFGVPAWFLVGWCWFALVPFRFWMAAARQARAGGLG